MGSADANQGSGPTLLGRSKKFLLKFGIHKGEATEGCLVHRVDEVLVTEGKLGFLIQELWVKVAVV